jgi:DNA polymerase-3 subunit gamma/tau
MQYQVLARKWRPQYFHEIVGQEHVTRTLLNALQSGRVAHAFLFSGPRGSGKTSTARILAKALNCHNDKQGEPCGHCPACTEIAAGNCIDVLEIDAASNTGVDNVRQLIEQARYNPARDRNRIFIVDEVHMLSNSAFSALLKTLEEPPAHVVFILATTEYHKIPATILSRCQQYSFKLISYPPILDRLRLISKSEGIQISNTALEQVVFSSGGSMRDAMSALDQVIAFSGDEVRDEDVTTLLGLVEPKILSQTVRAVAKSDLAAILKTVRDLVEAGQDLNNFVRRLSAQFRNLMVLKAGIADPALLGIPESLLPDLREQAELFSREDLLRLFDAFQKIETGMKYATQVRFQLEMGLIELAQLSRLRSLEDLIADFTSIAEGNREQKSEGNPLPPGSAAALSTERPAPAGLRAKPAPAPPSGKLPTPEIPKTGSVEASAPESGGTAPVRDPREFLIEIASAVGKESLESLLLTLDGARLEGEKVVLESAGSNEFSRRQIKENLSAICDAAAKVVGSRVAVILGETVSREPKPPSGSRSDPETPPEGGLLEKVKREPIIKSFLDVFPGPVKAEKIEP